MRIPATIGLLSSYGVVALSALTTVSCGPPRATSDVVIDSAASAEAGPIRQWLNCPPGQQRCFDRIAQRCVAQGEFSTYTETDCSAQGLECFETANAGLTVAQCLVCRPGARRCSEDTSAVEVCAADGLGWDVVQRPATSRRGEACRNAQLRGALPRRVDRRTRNIGCEYYAVDLDNAVTGDGRSAASQQYADRGVEPRSGAHLARGRIEIFRTTRRRASPRAAAGRRSGVIRRATSRCFELPAREVDCSAPGDVQRPARARASRRNAYRVTSTIPVIAYQFNPLDNVGVFSNDASLLLPTSAIGRTYTVVGWPQTIATTMNPERRTSSGDICAPFSRSWARQAQHARARRDHGAQVDPDGPDGAAAHGRSRRGVELRRDARAVRRAQPRDGRVRRETSRARRVTPMIGRRRGVLRQRGERRAHLAAPSSDRSCCADHLEEQLAPRRTAAAELRARAHAVALAGASPRRRRPRRRGHRAAVVTGS
jgi:hypothetical protein